MKLSFGVPEILIINFVSNSKKKIKSNGNDIIKCDIKKVRFFFFKRFLNELKLQNKNNYL